MVCVACCVLNVGFCVLCYCVECALCVVCCTCILCVVFLALYLTVVCCVS
jgi:hypothetical protein